MWFNTTDAGNSADLEFGLTRGSLWQPHCSQDQPAPPGGFGINPRLGAAALRAPAASKEDSRPQAILRFQPRNTFDYRVRYEPKFGLLKCYEMKKKISNKIWAFLYFCCSKLSFSARDHIYWMQERNGTHFAERSDTWTYCTFRIKIVHSFSYMHLCEYPISSRVQ